MDRILYAGWMQSISSENAFGEWGTKTDGDREKQFLLGYALKYFDQGGDFCT